MERPNDEMTASTGSRAEDVDAASTPEPAVSELKAEIEQTRGEMQQTIAEIQERLTPSHLAEQAKSTVRDATIGRLSNMAERAGDTATRVARQTRRAADYLPRPMRDNPLPFALIGAGVVWLVAGLRSHANGSNDAWRTDDLRSEDPYEPRYAYGESSNRQSSVSEAKEKVGEMASNVGRRARQLGRETQSRVSRTLDESPLMLGAVALVAGAIIGMMLPRTEVEDSYLGETRDNMVESAREMAQDKVEKLSDAIRDTGETGAMPR